LIFVGSSRNIQKKKTNIVFILIDDLGWKDAGFMGSEYYETPNIDRLAARGMVFTQAYANAANCAPSRSSLLTGQYSPRHGRITVGASDRGNSENRRIIPVPNNKAVSLDKITISEALKPAGYISASIGKWHIGNLPDDHGFDISITKGDISYGKGHFNETGEYLTDRLTDEAIGFIGENSDRPFFLYLSHHAVHTPIQAREEDIEYFSGKPPSGCHREAAYAAMIRSVDQSVGRITDYLKKSRLHRNTVVVFFSDNGGYGSVTCMEPLRGIKGMFYEGGIRVPMIVSWPGVVKRGSVCDSPVIGTDFYPTFLELAGMIKPEDHVLDGKSLLPLFKGSSSPVHESLYWHFPAYLDGGTHDRRDTLFRTRPVSVIRKGDWKLLLFWEEWLLDGGRDEIDVNNAVELYNITADTGEEMNLIHEELTKRDELLDDLLKWIKEIDAAVPVEINPGYGSS